MTAGHCIRLVLLATALKALLLPVPSRAETLNLRPGFQAILEQTGVSRISVGNPEVIEARPLSRGDGILVVGKKEGETDLVVWGNDRRVDWSVEVKEKKSSLYEEARAFAATFGGLVATSAGNSVILTGAVTSPGDKKLIEEFARSRQNLLLKISLPEDRKSLLVYDLKIIEISKGSTSQIGIRWPDSIGANASFADGNSAGAVFNLTSDFETRLNLLLADGRARILANPRIVCESGQNANFLAGGEIPIVIVTPESRTVEWKTYGIILNLSSKMAPESRIRTQITAEISTIDHGSGSSQVPGFLTRRVSTHFSAPSGGTVMLSGLLKSEIAKDVSKVPVLGQIPILGELFKSRSFRENQSELAIFITPSEIEGDDAGQSASWEARAREEKNGMRFRIVD